MQENHGLKSKAIVSMLQWDHKTVTNITLIISDFTEMTDWQFLKIQAAPILKKLKRLFKEC